LNMLEIVVSSVLGAAGGSGLVLLGLSGFLGKVWVNRIQQIDRLGVDAQLQRVRGEVDHGLRVLDGAVQRTTLVHRVQFETEFHALKDVWAKVARVRASLCAVRPIFSIQSLVQTKEEARAALFERTNQLMTDLREFVRVRDDLAPFYDATIYSALVELQKPAHKETLDIQLFDPDRTQDWWEQGEKNRNDFVTEADRIAALIRSRISALSIVHAE
jgi:hypothetical protein